MQMIINVIIILSESSKCVKKIYQIILVDKDL